MAHVMSPCMSPGPRPYYIYNGQKYESVEALQKALEVNRPPSANAASAAALGTGNGNKAKVNVASSTAQSLQRINSLLDDTSRFESLVHTLFGQYAGGDRRLRQHQCTGLLVSFGAQIGVHNALTMFGEVQHMFYRFDFDGTGTLEEKECMQMIKFVLRRVRDKLAPPTGLRLCRITRKNLDSEYRLVKQLGQGGQGVVYLAEKKGTSRGCQRVVKFYSKADVNAPLEDIKEEFMLLQKLDHPAIARVHDIFEDQAMIYVVSEPYFGGDLTTLVTKASKHGVSPTVSWIGGVLKQVLNGLVYLHEQHIMHCDIKEPNIMIANDSLWQTPRVVIIDFGMAKDFGGERQGGTPGYMPPEVWQLNLWTPKGDIFSLAMVFWGIFNGKMGGPFCVADAPPFTKIRMMTIHREINCEKLPPGLAELTTKMARKEHRKRPTAKEAVSSQFFKGLEREQNPISSGVLGALNDVAQKRNIQNIVAMDLLSEENLAELQHLNELFSRLDKDNSGSVDVEEAKEVFAHLGIAQADRVVSALMGENGTIHYSSFMAKLLLAQKGLCEEQLAASFASIDTDGSGKLDRHEIEALLARPNVSRLVGHRSVNSLMKEMDVDGDGLIDFEEFRRAMVDDHSHQPSVTWKVGDVCLYFSRNRNQWIPCKVIAACPKTGSVRLDVKPDQWMPPQMQNTLLKRGLRSWAVGDACLYFDQNQRKLEKGIVKAVDSATGRVAIDNYPRCWLPNWALCETDTQQTDKTCKAGHHLRQAATVADGMSCDICGTVFQAGVTMWGCRKCNYDICAECATSEGRHTEQEEETPNLVSYTAEVIQDFQASGASQLSLKKGEVVTVTEVHPSGWMGGCKVGDDNPGWFPRYCVRCDSTEQNSKSDKCGNTGGTHSNENRDPAESQTSNRNVQTPVAKDRPALETPQASPMKGRTYDEILRACNTEAFSTPGSHSQLKTPQASPMRGSSNHNSSPGVHSQLNDGNRRALENPQASPMKVQASPVGSRTVKDHCLASCSTPEAHLKRMAENRRRLETPQPSPLGSRDAKDQRSTPDAHPQRTDENRRALETPLASPIGSRMAKDPYSTPDVHSQRNAENRRALETPQPSPITGRRSVTTPFASPDSELKTEVSKLRGQLQQRERELGEELIKVKADLSEQQQLLRSTSSIATASAHDLKADVAQLRDQLRQCETKLTEVKAEFSREREGTSVMSARENCDDGSATSPSIPAGSGNGLKLEVTRLKEQIRVSELELTEVKAEFSDERARRHRAEDKVRDCAQALETAKAEIRADRAERCTLIAQLEEQHRQEKEKRLQVERELAAARASSGPPTIATPSPRESPTKTCWYGAPQVHADSASSTASIPPGTVRTQVQLWKDRCNGSGNADRPKTARTAPVLADSKPVVPKLPVPLGTSPATAEVASSLPRWESQILPDDFEDEDVGPSNMSPLTRLRPTLGESSAAAFHTLSNFSR